ncbi:MAG TPA: ATP-binding protein [Longimicrobiales bacterium]|nr:ATP-binding protein [Longimicrobiales bacterium]
MRLRIHHSLFGGFLGVMGLLVLLILGLVGSGLRRELLQTYETELEREIALASWIVERTDAQDADSVARVITDRIGYRVSLIDTTGVVLGDSYVEARRVAQVENHRGRPEIQGALEGQSVTFAERTSATVGVPLLYGARLVRFRDQPVILRVAAPLDTVEGTVRGIQRTVTLTGLAAIALALLVAYGLSRLLARPLVVLAERARQLAAGDFSARAPRGPGVVELTDLAAAFNRLTEELQARLKEMGRDRDEMGALIDTMAEGVVALTDDARVLRVNRAARALLDLPEDIPAFAPVGTLVRHQALRELLEDSVVHPLQSREIQLGDRFLLAASRRMALGGAVTTLLDVTETRRLEQVRRDFVANASHELKTPLTSIRGFAETLLEGDPPEALKSQFLAAIRDNTLRLQRLVEDLLDLSRLESGGWSASREVTSLAEVAWEVWRTFEETALGRGIEFVVEGDAEVVADRQGLVQVFRNLMENGLRHTDDGGHLHVRVTHPVPGLVEVAFSDDGEGIPSRALPRIFERFYRADSSRARDIGGTGLGLAIVRHLVGAMGGEVWAESTLGEGATIRFTLPERAA